MYYREQTSIFKFLLFSFHVSARLDQSQCGGHVKRVSFEATFFYFDSFAQKCLCARTTFLAAPKDNSSCPVKGDVVPLRAMITTKVGSLEI